MSNGSASIDTTRRAGAIPEGVHRFKIVDYEEREGPKGIYWAYTLEVEENGQFDGQNVWTNISLSDAARWKLEEFLDALQIEEGVQVTGDSFLGQSVRGEIVHDEYTRTNDQGKEETRKRAAISTFLPDSSGVANPSQAKKKTAKKVTPPAAKKEAEAVGTAPEEAQTAGTAPEETKAQPEQAEKVKRPF